MFFLANLFPSSRRKGTFKDFQMEKTRLERLLYYYQEKINYLSSPKIPPSLAAIACRDVPIHQTGGSRQINPKHIKMCLKYYKRKLSEVTKDLKNF